MSELNLSTSYRYHMISALVLSIWLVGFLVLFAPFDASDLSFNIRLRVMPTYGIITFIGYMLLIPVQNWALHKLGKWTLAYEAIFLLFFNSLLLVGCFVYYKTDIINGEYSFLKFTLGVYYPIFFTIIPILLIMRWFLNKKTAQLKIEKIVLTGENKMDVLQVKSEDLICISSADNYVEVTYILNGELTRKLLRTTLKNIHVQVPELMKIHRSHVINPTHFKEWKGSSSIILTGTELPVSKNYKKSLLTLDHSPLIANDSSLNLN